MISLSNIAGLKLSAARTRLLGEGVWVSIGQIIGAFGTLVGVRLLTGSVSPQVFGTIALLTGLSTLGLNLLCAPLTQAALRLYADVVRRGTLDELRLLINRGLFGTTSLLVLTMLLGGGAYALISGKCSVWVFVLLAALMPLEVMRTLGITMLVAARRQKPYSVWMALESWGRPALAIVAVSCFGPSAESVLLGYVVATALSWMAFQPLVNKVSGVGTGQPQPEVAPVADLAREIRQFALPLVPLAIFGWVTSLGERYIIGSMMGLELVGIYAATYGLVSRPFQMAGTIVGQTLKPVLFNAVSNGDRVRERRVICAWLGAALLAAGAGVVLFWIGSDWLARCLLAKEFRAGTRLMPWIALGYLAQMLTTVFEGVLFAHKRTRTVATLQAVVAAVAICSAFGGAAWFGLLGVAIACPVSFTIHAVLTALCVAHVRQAPSAAGDLAQPSPVRQAS